MSGAFGVSRPGGVKTTLHRHLRWAGHGGRAASRVQASPGARSPRASGGGRTASPRSPRPRLSRIRHRSWGSRPRLSSCVHVGPEGFSPAQLRRRLVLTSEQCRHRARCRFVVASRPRSSLNGWWSWGDGRRHTSLPCPRLRAGTLEAVMRAPPREARSGHHAARGGARPAASLPGPSPELTAARPESRPRCPAMTAAIGPGMLCRQRSRGADESLIVVNTGRRAPGPLDVGAATG